MESLFSQRPPRKRRFFTFGVLAILMEASLVGVAAIWPSYQSPPMRDPVTDIEAGLVNGGMTPELVAPQGEPVPAPESMPSPPPDAVQAPDDTPPPTDDPQMELPPPPKKLAKPGAAIKPIPAGARHGDRSQPGVPGGGSHAATMTGTSGFAQLAHLGVAGWHKPDPPYPAQARLARITGSGTISVSTNASGEVISAVINQSTGNAVLDHSMTSFAKTNWTGPPNATQLIPFTYRLQ